MKLQKRCLEVLSLLHPRNALASHQTQNGRGLAAVVVRFRGNGERSRLTFILSHKPGVLAVYGLNGVNFARKPHTQESKLARYWLLAIYRTRV
jgi:hypothetical protein